MAGALRRGKLRRASFALAAILASLLAALAFSRLGFSRLGSAFASLRVGWLGAALLLMAVSLLLRAESWHAVLRAALPQRSVSRVAVARATMIGVMASALMPGRLGELCRALVMARRLGEPRRSLPVVVGTLVSQTVLNLVALAGLAVVALAGVAATRSHTLALAVVLALPLAIAAAVALSPRLLASASRARRPRLRRLAALLHDQLGLVRRGLQVFADPLRGLHAGTAQLLAWALQWLACYCVLLAVHLRPPATLATAAAVLFAVNVTAVLPPAPSNVGVFQAACIVVLAAYGVGAGRALAYGIVLQAVEVATAVGLGVPALLVEGLGWRSLRDEARVAAEAGGERAP